MIIIQFYLSIHILTNFPFFFSFLPVFFPFFLINIHFFLDLDLQNLKDGIFYCYITILNAI